MLHGCNARGLLFSVSWDQASFISAFHVPVVVYLYLCTLQFCAMCHSGPFHLHSTDCMPALAGRTSVGLNIVFDRLQHVSRVAPVLTCGTPGRLSCLCTCVWCLCVMLVCVAVAAADRNSSCKLFASFVLVLQLFELEFSQSCEPIPGSLCLFYTFSVY